MRRDEEKFRGKIKDEEKQRGWIRKKIEGSGGKFPSKRECYEDLQCQLEVTGGKDQRERERERDEGGEEGETSS